MTTTVCGRCGAEHEGSPALCPSCGEDPLVAGRYLLLGVLGRGGSGMTWRARRHPDGALVCLKELRWDRMGSLKDEELFHREAAILKTLRHPNIPAYLDDFAWPTEVGPRHALWLAQELVDGESLEAERMARRYRVDDLLAIGEEIAAILAALGGERPPVVHRDIKPGNIMRRKDGRLMLVDFGAARAAGVVATGGTTVAGTFGFMAPEQLRGEASAAADVYGLAMTLAVMWAGGAPEALLDVANRPDLGRVAGLPAAHRALLEEMLAQDPSARPSAREVERRIRSLRRGDVPAPARPASIAVERRMALATTRSSPIARAIKTTIFLTVLAVIAVAAWMIFRKVDDVMSASRTLPAPTPTLPIEKPPARVEPPVVEPAAIAEPPRPVTPPSPEQLAKEHQASLVAANEACRAGTSPSASASHEACARLWQGYLGEDKAALVALGLAATLASACEHGDAEACGLRGTLSMDGAGVPESRADGRSWYIRACDAGHVETCALSGRMLVDGDAGPIDAKRGVAQLQKACDAGDEVACMNIGVALARGQGIPADRARALAIFEKACKGGQSLACKNLDGLVGNNWGLPSDAKERWAVLVRLCDARIGTACARAGDAAQAGRGTARDAAMALDYRRRACNLGVDAACPKVP